MKVITLLIGLVILLISPTTTWAATLTLSPASGVVNRGCTLSVKIELDTQGSVTDGTDAVLKFDSSRFSTATILNGTIYPDYPGNSVDNASGKINVSGLAAVAQGFNGRGTLATLNLTASPTAPAGATQITFDFDPNDKTKTTDSNVVERGTVADMLSQVVNGSYTIGTGGACASQGAPDETTPSATLAPEVKKVLPDAGLTETTLILTVVGGLLTLLGVLGLALL